MGEIFASGIIMKARWFERKDRPGRFIVYLHWKNKQYRRSHYDKVHPLIHPDMAAQVAGAINAAIANDPDGFDPRQWFRLDSEYSFDTYARYWLRDRTAHYAPSVIRDVHRYVQMAMDHFGDQDLRGIKLLHIEAWTKKIPGSNKTKKNGLSVLHKMLSDAYRLEMIPRIPGFPRLEIDEPEIKWLSAEEQAQVLEHIPERDRPIINFLMTYGVRIGEARALQWEDIDFGKRIITIKRSYSGRSLRTRTKTGGIRYLPLIDPIEAALKPIRGIAGPVFRNFYNRPYTAEISRIWRQAVRFAGLPPITLYQGTRHSWASQRVNSGANMEMIRDILGHTTIQTTQRYVKVGMESKRGLFPNPHGGSETS